MSVDFERLAARWVLGLIPGSELPKIATQALSEGHDGPAIREIAGMAAPALRDTSERFEMVLGELNVPRPSRKAAALVLAQDYAKQMLAGSLGPYEGAKKIWLELAEAVRADHDARLDPFIYWASEHEDTLDLQRRRECEAAILESARELVAS